MLPTIFDFVMKSDRKTQIVYPKDLGYIAIRTGLKSGCNVLEIGTGSASLTTFFASLVGPSGHVFTYDINEEFMPARTPSTCNGKPPVAVAVPSGAFAVTYAISEFPTLDTVAKPGI